MAAARSGSHGHSCEVLVYVGKVLKVQVDHEEEEVGEIGEVVVVSLTCARQTGTHVRYSYL